MIRITELSLPWGDPTETRAQDALRRAILKRLAIGQQDLEGFTVYKRSHDARRKDREIAFVYIVDVTVQPSATPRHAAMRWAQRLRRVFAIEIDTCARCQGRLRAIARILAHRERECGAAEPELAPIAARAPPRQSGLL